VNGDDFLARLADVIESRRGGDPDRSYVARLFARAPDAILKKNGEEDKVETQITTERTERSSSKASRCSFDAYERRVLHLSILSTSSPNQRTKSHKNNTPMKPTPPPSGKTT
jgi:phosphoribosyl-ATP pyrophosphohydrolase